MSVLQASERWVVADDVDSPPQPHTKTPNRRAAVALLVRLGRLAMGRNSIWRPSLTARMAASSPNRRWRARTERRRLGSLFSLTIARPPLPANAGMPSILTASSLSRYPLQTKATCEDKYTDAPRRL